jgi:tRNA pseudouridine38-40 synthase
MERGSCQGKRRIALLVQYDGTGFIGWQVQDDGRSVQGDIEKAIEILTKEKCRTIAAGRTDTGVHAIGQVVHFNTSSALSLSRLCIGLNGIMGRDVSVVNAYNVPDSFHSRYSAVEREYIYRIYNSPQRSPFMLYRSM